MKKKRELNAAPAGPMALPSAPLTAMVLEPDLYWEAKVAENLGLARERLHALRVEHLHPGDDYIWKGNEVVLTAPGLARLNDLIKLGARTAAGEMSPATGQETAPVPTSAHKNNDEPATPKGPPSRAKFTVMKVPANQHLLYCQKEAEKATGRMVLVRVKDNTLFMPRMVLEAIEAEQGSWQFRGRLPRRKGRW